MDDNSRKEETKEEEEANEAERTAEEDAEETRAEKYKETRDKIDGENKKVQDSKIQKHIEKGIQRDKEKINNSLDDRGLIGTIAHAVVTAVRTVVSFPFVVVGDALAAAGILKPDPQIMKMQMASKNMEQQRKEKERQRRSENSRNRTQRRYNRNGRDERKAENERKTEPRANAKEIIETAEKAIKEADRKNNPALRSQAMDSLRNAIIYASEKGFSQDDIKDLQRNYSQNLDHCIKSALEDKGPNGSQKRIQTAEFIKDAIEKKDVLFAGDSGSWLRESYERINKIQREQERPSQKEEKKEKEEEAKTKTNEKTKPDKEKRSFKRSKKTPDIDQREKMIKAIKRFLKEDDLSGEIHNSDEYSTVVFPYSIDGDYATITLSRDGNYMTAIDKFDSTLLMATAQECQTPQEYQNFKKQIYVWTYEHAASSEERKNEKFRNLYEQYKGELRSKQEHGDNNGSSSKNEQKPKKEKKIEKLKEEKQDEKILDSFSNDDTHGSSAQEYGHVVEEVEKNVPDYIRKGEKAPESVQREEKEYRQSNEPLFPNHDDIQTDSYDLSDSNANEKNAQSQDQDIGDDAR